MVIYSPMAAETEIARALGLHRAGDLVAAERCYRQILAGDPAQDTALHLLGLIRLQHRDVDGGIRLIRQSIDVGPPVAERFKDLGSALSAAGQPEAAEAAFRSALELKPGLAAAWSGLGGALRHSGRYLAAIEALRNSVANGMREPRTRLQLAALLADVGDYDAAGGVYQGLLASDPHLASAAAGLAQIGLKFDQAAEAEAVCRKALASNPDDVELLATLGEALLRQQRAEEAVATLRQAQALDPGHAWAFFNLGQALIKSGLMDQAFLLRWLSLQGPVPPTVIRAAIDHLKALPEYRQLDQAPASIATEKGVDLDSGAAKSLIANPVLRSILRRALLDDMDLERMLSRIRRAFLLRDTGPDRQHAEGADTLDFLCALAEHCFNNEFVFAESADETEAASRLRTRLEHALSTAETPPAQTVALAAAYFPLHGISGSEQLVKSSGLRQVPPILALLRQQIEEPREERILAAEVPALTGIADEVSRAVREQYEENPYPRWRDVSRLETRSIEAVLTGLFPFLGQESPTWPRHPRILIAGCGTGHQSIASAQRYNGCEVTALDLSRASLGYAARKTRQAGLGNIKHVQGDILELGGTPQAFDLIECAGVLHHMAEPLEGWRVLRGLLAPGGFMKIGLYSEIGRRSIVAARELIAAEGFPSTPEGIRKARQWIAQLPADNPAHQVRNRPDFYSMSTCRDMIFHVQEHRLQTIQIAQWLDVLQLEFLGFELASSAIARDYRQRFPDDPDMRCLENWGSFEQEHTGAFAGMYLFWARDPGHPPARP